MNTHAGTGPTTNSTLAGTDAETTAFKRVRRPRPISSIRPKYGPRARLLPVPLADVPLWNRRIRDWMVV